MKETTYSNHYFSDLSKGSLQSAIEVIPVIKQFINPGSVADVGCGIGTWLSIWAKHGIVDMLGIDGAYIEPQQLLIEKNFFFAANLENEIKYNRKFDLVMSLEVAEHLNPGSAKTFIHSLTQLGDVIVFSAAIPYQGGVHHVNEQYPEYWIKHFKEEGFTPYDVLREILWNNNKIDASYRQNILFFVKDDVKGKYQSITQNQKVVLPLVHPDLYEYWMRELVMFRHYYRTPFHAVWFFIKKYYKRIFSKRKGNG